MRASTRRPARCSSSDRSAAGGVVNNLAASSTLPAAGSSSPRDLLGDLVGRADEADAALRDDARLAIEKRTLQLTSGRETAIDDGTKPCRWSSLSDRLPDRDDERIHVRARITRRRLGVAEARELCHRPIAVAMREEDALAGDASM